MIRAGILLLLIAAQAQAAKKSSGPGEFTEEYRGKRGSSGMSYYKQLQKSKLKRDEAELSSANLIQSARTTYEKFNNRVRVPGFISGTPIPQLAKIIGPVTPENSLRMGDTIYMRWSGAPLPRPGDRYSSFTPALVLQNLQDPTDFQVFAAPARLEKLPTDFRMAGYFYEVTGQIKIIRVKGGVVEGMLEQLKNQVSVGDELMARPPLVQNLTPISSGIQLSAAVICGSPHDRLSTTKRSFLFINRGSRDGIRVGRIFESIEAVKLDEAIGGSAPEVSNGEAIVIHVTDSYSTAMITKQFDVIRIGSLLRTKQETNPINPISPFGGYQEEKEAAANDGKGVPEVPSIDDLPGSKDKTLPDPRRKKAQPSLSDLDAMEKALKMQELTPAERSRLNKLSRQERVGAEKPEEAEDESGTPGAPTVENSFKGPKKADKKAKKKGKSKNDEEELNQLMMQN